MKKYSSILVIAMIFLLTACGGAATPTAETEPFVTPTSAAETEAAETSPTVAVEATQPAGAEASAAILTDTTDISSTVSAMELSDEIKTNFPVDKMTTTASGLQYQIIDQGDGPVPQIGEVVKVHYAGYLANGAMFDSSYNYNEPVTFAYGGGKMIPGWDEAVGLLSKGGKIKLIIGPEQAFGEQGVSGVIPGNATLYFELELVDISEGSPANPTEVKEGDFTVLDNGVKYADLKSGEGEALKSGQVASLHYTAWYGDGTKFDSSIDSGTPLKIQVGAGQFVPGSEDALVGMKPGGTRQVQVPTEVAFKDLSTEGQLPPGDYFIMELQLIEILPGAPEAPTKVADADYVTTASGLKYYDFEVGTGETPQTGQQVSVHYTGWLTDGTMFDSSIPRGEPIVFAIGTGSVIPGWDEGVSTMKVGGKRQLVISPDLGYGETGTGPIPGNATLIFEVELVSVK